MTDLRQAAQQALEALENSSPDQYPEDAGVYYDAKDALRTALEQQAEPVAQAQEPFEDLATELFVIAQTSPADDGFSDTIERIELWLREHFSTPPQRKPFDLLVITTAYEQGVGKGHQAHGRSAEIENPYAPGECQQAWALGYDEGKKQAASKAVHGIKEQP
jgi:hypothetical protein